MSRDAWLTKSAIPSSRVTRNIELPDDEAWIADFLGAFYLLTQAQNWEASGSLTPDEMASEWLEVFLEFEQNMDLAFPPGLICPFAGSVPPSGWLLCDGSELLRADYPELFNVIGGVYGSNGTTTFYLPNLKGRFIFGVDNYHPLGTADGQEFHTLTVAEMPSHTHIQNAHTHPPPVGAQAFFIQPNAIGPVGYATGSTMGTNSVTGSAMATNQNAGGGQPHNNMPPYRALNFIIKT